MCHIGGPPYTNRFHLGEVGGTCGRDAALVFGDTIATDTTRFVETKSIGVGPSFMMQFDLVIGCGDPVFQDSPNKVVLEYSLNHGITWRLVQRPCSPSTPGCQTYFTRGTVYHPSEFTDWRRITIKLPQHTWYAKLFIFFISSRSMCVRILYATFELTLCMWVCVSFVNMCPPNTFIINLSYMLMCLCVCVCTGQPQQDWDCDRLRRVRWTNLGQWIIYMWVGSVWDSAPATATVLRLDAGW